MQTALAHAQWGWGRVAENPSVGCVILCASGHVVGVGHTADGGRPHAETVALTMAGKHARGGTAYVTLEPCSHHGQTPPCADGLIQAGIARVVVACTDPDPRVSGQGINRLKQAGITVDVGCCGADGVGVHAGFFSRIIRNRPWITAKIATTMDGKIATTTGHSQWITGAVARTHGQVLRSQNDGILVGAGTVRADNPRLTCRINGICHTPARVVLGGADLAQSDFSVFDGTTPLYHYTNGGGAVDMAGALADLATHGINRLMVEGGGQILSTLLKQGFIDELHWIHAPTVMGGDGLPAVADLGLNTLDEMAGFSVLKRQPLGTDMLSILRPNGALDFAQHLTNI